MKTRLKNLIPRISLKKWLILILVLGFLFFIVNNFINGNKKKEVPQFASVKRQNIRSSVSASGILSGKDTVNLKFKSLGKLATLNVKEGDQVKKGQVIASLDTQDLSITLQQAQNTLRDKQAIIDKILDDVKDHKNDETFTQRQSRTTAEVARDNAFDSVKAAQRAFQDSVLLTPIDGVVTQINVVDGQNVSSSDVIAQVVDESEIYFDAEIDESDIGKISINQPAEITLNAYGDRIFKGLVSLINQTTKTTSSGATVVIVRIKLFSEGIRFTNGLNGQGSVITAEHKNALVVPQESVQDNQVIINKGGEFEKRQIKVGISSDTDTEILEGLSEGEEIVTNPSIVKTPQQRTQNPFNRFFRGLTGGRRI